MFRGNDRQRSFRPEDAMLSMPKRETDLDDLQDQVGRAQFVTPDLIANVAARIGARLAVLHPSSRAARINRLMEAQAWTETALALVELETSQWKLHRIVHVDGAWLCSLSKQLSLPEWLGDIAEASHESLPLAILSALLEARRCDESSPAGMKSSVPRVRSASSSSLEVVCCDNFA
jgi:hypothetical protein